jgi:hypothetical protein
MKLAPHSFAMALASSVFPAMSKATNRYVKLQITMNV